jgi:TRAP transporter TAXI family solute receptor
MFLKRGMLGVLALLLISSSLSLACAPKAPAEKVSLKIGAAPAGTASYIRSEALGEAIRRGNPDYDVIVLSGGTATNLERLRRGDIDLSASGGGKEANLKLLQLSNPEAQLLEGNSISPRESQTLQYIIDPALGITSLPDLIAKKPALKLVIGRKGASPLLSNIEAFQAHGINIEDIEAWGGKLHYETGTKGWSLYKDGLVDAYFHPSSVPTPEIVEMKRPMRMLPLTEEAIEKLASKWFQPAVIPKGTYPWLEEDIPTVSAPTLLQCRSEMSEEVVYNITKSIIEGKEYLVSIHPQFEEMLIPEMVVFMDSNLYPLHPGARKYYQEIGWIE